MDKKTSAKTILSKVASHVPGRIRLKLHQGNRDRETMEAIQRKLKELEGVDDVKLNHDCGSVTVLYDKGRHSMGGILRFFEDLDVVVESIGHLPAVGEEDDNGHTPEFLAAINDINRRIRKATGLPVNLKLALPLAFVGAGVWSIGKRGLMIESVPGWFFMWLAFDIFVKLHPARRSQA